MKMITCKSSGVSAIGHKGDTLRVAYKSGGTYDFPGVTVEAFNALRGAKSIGRHIHTMKLKDGKQVHIPKK